MLVYGVCMKKTLAVIAVVIGTIFVLGFAILVGNSVINKKPDPYEQAAGEELIRTQRQKILESNKRQEAYCKQIKDMPINDVEGSKLCQKLGLPK